MLVPDSSQPGTSGKLQFDERRNLAASSRRRSRSKAPLDQPTAILATNSRMGNNFLHDPQTADLLREDYHRRGVELWKYEPIEAFVLVTQEGECRNSFMSSSFASLFCKTAGCPTSQVLLAYRCSLASPTDLAYVESHLGSCDFCGAELQLLARYRGESEEYSFAEMPEHLRQLAEDLLKRSTAPFTGFAGLAEKHQVSH